MNEFPKWPSWRYSAESPKGRIFEREADIPNGWVDNPAKIAAVAPVMEQPIVKNKGGRPKKTDA